MKVDEIIQRWKNEEHETRLDSAPGGRLAVNPAGLLQEISPEELAQSTGGGTTIITTSSWVCGVMVTVSFCDELQEWINNLPPVDLSGVWPNSNKGCCFTAGTPVQTRNGRRPIASFNEGDTVLGFDLQAGCVREGRVTDVEVHEGRFPVLELESRGCRVQVTPGHRFHTRERWAPVECLHGKSAVDIRERKNPMSLAGLRGASTVYNLRVEGLESYFVGDTDLLVRDN